MQRRAIVGIEIEIVDIRGKWKTSQNRNAADRAGVAAGLDALGRRGLPGDGEDRAGDEPRLSLPPALGRAKA